MADLVTNRITRVQSSVINEAKDSLLLTLDRDDGAEVILEFDPILLAEFVGVARMAFEVFNEGYQSALPADEAMRLVGSAASVAPDNTSIRITIEDKDGILHHFDVDHVKCFRLRQSLTKALTAIRGANTETSMRNDVVEIEVNNQEQ